MEGGNVVMRILNAEPQDYSRKAYSLLSQHAEVVEEHLTQQQLTSTIKDFDVVIVRLGLRLDKAILSNAVRLKYILTATTGTDHIDVEEASARKIQIISLKNEIDFLDSIPSTAEHTWALMLSLLRKLPDAFHDVKAGQWDRQKFRGNNLRNKKLGIIGLGRVGKQVARFGLAFGTQVGAYDPFQSNWIGDVVKFEHETDLLTWADIISVHIPLDSRTENFLDREKLTQVKRGALLINTSRAGVWDENAVADLLAAGHLGGVATDVVSNEQDDSQRMKGPLLTKINDFKNLIVTPHIGGATYESMEMTEVFIAEKFLRTLSLEKNYVRH
jgi:D-3-phosphoglycerate dehydrogenase / 2-oxoglutarate reductase